MRDTRHPLAIGFFFLFALTQPAMARDAYTLVFEDSGPLASLLRIDPVTGGSTLVGPLGAAAEVLTSDEAGTLYSASAAEGLLRVDPDTGVATPIGPFGLTLAKVRGLTFDAAVGTLWMLADLPGSPGPQALYEVDPATGAADASPISFSEIRLLTVAALAGRLYCVGQISFSTYFCEIERVTGQVILIGEDLSGPAIIPTHMVGDSERGDLFAIAFMALSPTNTLTPSASRVDPATGELSCLIALPFTVGDDATYDRLSGVGLVRARGTLDIPTLSPAGGAVLIVLLAVAALWVRRGGLE